MLHILMKRKLLSGDVFVEFPPLCQAETFNNNYNSNAWFRVVSLLLFEPRFERDVSKNSEAYIEIYSRQIRARSVY